MNLIEIQQGCAKRGLSFQHLAVVSALREHGPLAMAGIAAKILITSAGATSLVDTMESLGLVKRKVDAHDRRKVNVTATKKALRHLDYILNCKKK